MSLVEEAIDVEQYNTAEMDWQSEGGHETPQRAFMTRVLDLDSLDLAGKSVLDVGCGTGWLLKACLDRGAERAVGLEPSKYAEHAQEVVPNAEIIQTDFQSYEPHLETFDLVSFIMSTEHIEDIGKALQKAAVLLEASGTLLIMTGDFDAFQAERFDYVVTTEELISGKEAASRVQRSWGTLTDIIRTVDYWYELLQANGFKVMDHQPIVADDQYVADIPKYALYQDAPFLQLFRSVRV